MQLDEELFVSDHFFLPGFAIDSLQGIELLLWEVHTLPMDVLITRRPADRRFPAPSTSVGAVDDPLQNAHVLPEAGPQELAVLVLAEPVHMEDTGSACKTALDLDPVTEVITHV